MTLRTYAIDNNRNSYDANYWICFVEADPAVMDPLLTAYLKAWPLAYQPNGPCVVFTADQVSWRDDKPMPFNEWIGRLGPSETTRDVAAAEEFRRLALTVETLGPGSRKWLLSLNFRLGTL